MTAVPPPVPPEIVEKAAKALVTHDTWTNWDPPGPAMVTQSCECGKEFVTLNESAQHQAEQVLAAVYGDIVEAARRDALQAAARVIGDEAAADGVYGTDVQGGLLRAGWIVGNMARHGLSASVSDQGADPRTPTTPEAAQGDSGPCEEDAETFTVSEIRAAFAAASPDDWGVPCHYETTMLLALRGER